MNIEGELVHETVLADDPLQSIDGDPLPRIPRFVDIRPADHSLRGPELTEGLENVPCISVSVSGVVANQGARIRFSPQFDHRGRQLDQVPDDLPEQTLPRSLTAHQQDFHTSVLRKGAVGQQFGNAVLLLLLTIDTLVESSHDLGVVQEYALTIQSIISTLASKGYATATMKQIKQIATSIMKVAVTSDLLAKNPFADVTIPVKKKTQRRALTQDEVMLITNTWKGHRVGPMAMIMLYAGLRRGEVQVLEWSDIDFDNKVIHITKACSSLKNVPIIKAPKSKAGIRDIPIPDLLMDCLTEIRRPFGFICTSAGGKMLTESSFQVAWKSYQNYLNICAGGRNGAGPHVPRIQVIDNITAHMLRHTYATMLYDADVDVKSAQRFLGHADIEMTLKVYTHLTKYKEEKAIGALNAHLNTLNMEHKNEMPNETNGTGDSVSVVTTFLPHTSVESVQSERVLALM